jgi:hypothetical protein
MINQKFGNLVIINSSDYANVRFLAPVCHETDGFSIIDGAGQEQGVVGVECMKQELKSMVGRFLHIYTVTRTHVRASWPSIAIEVLKSLYLVINAKHNMHHTFIIIFLVIESLRLK